MSEIAKHWIDGEWTSTVWSRQPRPRSVLGRGPTAAKPRPARLPAARSTLALVPDRSLRHRGSMRWPTASTPAPKSSARW